MEVKAESFQHLQELLFEDSFNSRLGRFKSRYAFRGVSDKDYKLETSLMRIGGDYKNVESHIIRQFKKYAYQFIEEKDNDWYWLSVGQHYGLPTRILDWSYSPDVALHFCTSNIRSFNKDGAVWMVNYKKIHKYVPPKIKGYMEQEKTWIMTSELMKKFIHDFGELEKLHNSDGDFVLFFEPPAIDSRIYNQFAYFSLASRSDLILDDYLSSYPDLWKKIVVPAELKWEIRDKLDQNNVSERILFPGLEGLSSWLGRYYMPTGSAK